MFQKNDLVETQEGLGVIRVVYFGGHYKVEFLETGEHIFCDEWTLLKIPDDSI